MKHSLNDPAFVKHKEAEVTVQTMTPAGTVTISPEARDKLQSELKQQEGESTETDSEGKPLRLDGSESSSAAESSKDKDLTPMEEMEKHIEEIQDKIRASREKYSNWPQTIVNRLRINVSCWSNSFDLCLVS